MAGSHADSRPAAVPDPGADARLGMLTQPRMRPLLLDGLAALGSLVMTVTRMPSR